MSKEEAVDLMKSLLKEVGVGASWKWDDALRNIKTNYRYKFLKMSMQEQKNAFQEYLRETRQKEREQEAIKKQRQRDLFMNLLEENKVLLSLNGNSKYYKICNRLAKRDYKRFMAVDERDRKEFFQDYIEELF